MPDAGDSQSRIQELRLRWDSDPSAKIYLQLAEEYRKAGRLEDAIQVLRTSLEHRPRDPRGRVALARCHIEEGQAVEAAEQLEKVTRQDPAHVVANKLLVEAYLSLGDAEKGADRLNIYRLLNDRDPELDHLEYRLSQVKAGMEARAPEPPAETESSDAGAGGGTDLTPTEQVAMLAREAAGEAAESGPAESESGPSAPFEAPPVFQVPPVSSFEAEAARATPGEEDVSGPGEVGAGFSEPATAADPDSESESAEAELISSDIFESVPEDEIPLSAAAAQAGVEAGTETGIETGTASRLTETSPAFELVPDESGEELLTTATRPAFELEPEPSTETTEAEPAPAEAPAPAFDFLESAGSRAEETREPRHSDAESADGALGARPSAAMEVSDAFPAAEPSMPFELEPAPAAEPVSEEPIAEESSPDEPAAEAPPSDEPPTEATPAAEAPIDEAPTREPRAVAPAPEEPATEVPSPEAPIDEAPIHEPRAVAPAPEEPASEAPSPEEPAAEELFEQLPPRAVAPAPEEPAPEVPSPEEPAAEELFEQLPGSAAAQEAPDGAGDLFDLGPAPPAPSLDALFDLGEATSEAPTLDDLWQATGSEPVLSPEADELASPDPEALEPEGLEAVVPEAVVPEAAVPEAAVPEHEPVAEVELLEVEPGQLEEEEAELMEVEAAEEPAVRVAAAEADSTEVAAAEVELADATMPEGTAEPPAAPAEDTADQPATATLGQLYLRQGHREEARHIFEEVLARDPENVLATEGLEQLRATSHAEEPGDTESGRSAAEEPSGEEWEPSAASDGRAESSPAPADPAAPAQSEEAGVRAAQLLADRSLSGQVPEGLTAKKILVLEQYRKLLRSPGDNP
ncbi:MAG: tetratricopeptide repeat protein [Holophagales bacterium]|nr:tetratricopeptide repeat protein [Holophagales bacterium]